MSSPPVPEPSPEASDTVPEPPSEASDRVPEPLSEASDSGTGQPVMISRKAVYSVVCGIAAFACIYVAPVGGLLLGLPSVTSGIHARREIANSKGQRTGDTVASIGIMIGAGAMVTVALSWVLPLVTS